jgi:hypothetical protein
VVGQGVEREAAALEDGVARVRLDGWPDREGAVVDQGQDKPWIRSRGGGAQDKKCDGEKESGSHFCECR